MMNGEDRRDAEEQKLLRLGAGTCERRRDATMWLSSSEGGASSSSLSYFVSPAPVKTPLDMTNLSLYILLSAPARWHCIQVPAEGCPWSGAGSGVSLFLLRARAGADSRPQDVST